MLRSWNKELYNGTESNYFCRWNLHHWETAWTTKWEAEWLKQLAGSQWISRGVVALHLRKGKTFPGQTSKVLVWLRQQTAECSKGAGEVNTNSRKTKPTRSCNKKAVDMHVDSFTHTDTHQGSRHACVQFNTHTPQVSGTAKTEWVKRSHSWSYFTVYN